MHCWTIIAAGGHGTRLASPEGAPKQFLSWRGLPLFWHAALPFTRLARVKGIVFVFPDEFLEEARGDIAGRMRREAPGLPWLAVAGGASRQESVHAGISALPRECECALIHDAARPFVSPALANRVLDGLEGGEAAVIPGIAVTDTIKEVDAAGHVQATHERASLRAVQTPQGFRLDALRAGHEQAKREGWTVTDDAALLERSGFPVRIVPGEETNRKITTPADLALLGGDGGKESDMHLPAFLPCTGFGYDVHRYGGTRPFVLGGIPIATDIGVSAHSDGDTLLHALTDALLGCIGQGDIGTLFPDTDPACDGLSSGVMLAEALRRFEQEGLILCQTDLTIVAQVPKIAPHRENIRRNVATLLRLAPERVGLKATTEEKLGFTGEKQGIKAYAVVSALRPTRS